MVDASPAFDVGDGDGPPPPRTLITERSRVDRIYRGVVTTAGGFTFVVLFLIGLFLFLKGLPSVRKDGLLTFLTTKQWDITKTHVHFGIVALLYWTVVIAIIALVTAVPVSIATALCITECAPPALARILVSVIDLLAAIPSVIFGIWGLFFFQNDVAGVARWMSVHMAFIPIFSSNVKIYTSSALVAGLVVGIMVLPIVTSISRQVFALAPAGEREGALALGATRWDVIRTVVLPFGRGGVIGAIFLGMGRALGETIAVYLIISPILATSPHILQAGANSIAAFITLRFGSGDKLYLSSLLAAGFALFVVTLAANLAGAWVVRRSRSGTGVEI